MNFVKVFGAVLFFLWIPSISQALSASCLLSPSEARSYRLDDYVVTQKSCRASGNETLQAIREMRTSAGETVFLAVDTQSLRTFLVKGSCLRCQASQVPPSRYQQVLQKGAQAPQPLQNDGLTHSLNRVAGPLLTVDLCPSKKVFERRLFEALLRSPLRSPIPVGIAITGRWMETHPGEMNYLLGLEEKNEIKIWWINHSYSHPYSKNRPLASNFLLSPGVDFESEVFSVEVGLIERGITPSAFFRFPGLVSDARQVHQLSAWGLIPLGSDAWLAKGERPKDGSVILVHGNGNEPAGIDAFIQRELGNLDVLVSFEQAFGAR